MPKDFKFCPICGSMPTVTKSPPPPPNYNQQPPPPNYNQQPPPPNYNQQPPQQPNYNPQYQAGYKSADTATILAAVLGIFGLCGIGHMYAGRVGKGVGLLIGTIILFIIGFATVMFGVGAIFLIGGFILYIWHIFDARNLCRQYNDFLSRNGRPPW